MKTRSDEIDLAMHVWKDAITHLRRKINLAGDGARMDSVDDDDDQRQSSLAEMRGQIVIYSLCLDWATQQKALESGVNDGPTLEQRDRFYRLMAVLAKAEIDCEDHLRSVAFVASGSVQHLTNQQAVTELQEAADSALERLIESEGGYAAEPVKYGRSNVIKPLHFS